MGLTEEFEKNYWALDKDVLGLDEAGRGPMAGPCVVCGVIFPKGYDNPLINDSKKLSDKKRQEIVEVIYQDAKVYQIEVVSVETIDELNIYKATQMAMEKIARDLNASVVLSDAMPLNVENKEVVSIVKGDARSISIAAASIIAKTVRDAMMIELDAKYPKYGFKNHKGYGTKAHKEAILKYGRTSAHRKSFRFKEEVQMSLDI